jgi:hypothetical protein
MKRRSLGIGCAILLLLPLAAVAALALRYGIVRTTEPVAPAHRANGLVLELDNWSNAPPTRVRGLVHDLDYPDLSRVRGRLTATAAGVDPKTFRISARALAQPDSLVLLDCYEPTPDAACITVFGVPPGTLANGLEFTVTGEGDNGPRSFTHVFRFEKRTTYSLVWWEGLMGI